MAWIKRAFDSAGLTQHPVGPHLSAVQALFGGSVILCLDVSGSMSGSRLLQAVKGCDLFIAEAIEAGYAVGGVLWHHDVLAHTEELSRDDRATRRLFASARANGGNNILPTLALGERMLEGKTGDLVIAIFGDGDLGNPSAALSESGRLLGKGIRVLTCGLGDASAAQLGAISSEGAAPRVAQADDIAGAIARMAGGLKRRT